MYGGQCALRVSEGIHCEVLCYHRCCRCRRRRVCLFCIDLVLPSVVSPHRTKHLPPNEWFSIFISSSERTEDQLYSVMNTQKTRKYNCLQWNVKYKPQQSVWRKRLNDVNGNFALSSENCWFVIIVFLWRWGGCGKAVAAALRESDRKWLLYFPENRIVSLESHLHFLFGIVSCRDTK